MFLRGDADQSRLSGRWEEGVIVKAGAVLQDPFRDDVITLFSRESFVEATRHFRQFDSAPSYIVELLSQP